MGPLGLATTLKEMAMSKQGAADNHSNQLNPNNDTYWQSRGWDERPDDWEERAEGERTRPEETEERGSKSKGK